ncbi:hypothetical protein K1T71_007866 [Dendrolimus kikuchii]|uniref:Uncharacterized protein n=1 Tax=Dendrolimus kikuchii TaxID=765133 RepID=A0ACC1CYL5_9NEOP|nr:hypothetical protein K1T71_007866 [Dendrolimus kikuchii]
MERVCVSAFFVSSEFESNENDKKRELDEMCEDRDMVELCENVEKTDIFDSEYDQELYEICTMYENLFDSEYDTNLYEICTTIENNVIVFYVFKGIVYYIMEKFDFKKPVEAEVVFEDSDDEKTNSTNNQCSKMSSVNCLNKQKPRKRKLHVDSNDNKVSKSDQLVTLDQIEEKAIPNYGTPEKQFAMAPKHLSILNTNNKNANTTDHRETETTNLQNCLKLYTDLIVAVCENLVMIVKVFQNLKNYRIDPNKRNRYKNYYLTLSYTTVTTVFIPRKDNVEFRNYVISLTLEIAKKKNIQCEYRDIEPLYYELIKWSLWKKTQIQDLSDTVNNIHQPNVYNQTSPSVLQSVQNGSDSQHTSNQFKKKPDLIYNTINPNHNDYTVSLQTAHYGQHKNNPFIQDHSNNIQQRANGYLINQTSIPQSSFTANQGPTDIQTGANNYMPTGTVHWIQTSMQNNIHSNTNGYIPQHAINFSPPPYPAQYEYGSNSTLTELKNNNQQRVNFHYPKDKDIHRSSHHVHGTNNYPTLERLLDYNNIHTRSDSYLANQNHNAQLPNAAQPALTSANLSSQPIHQQENYIQQKADYPPNRVVHNQSQANIYPTSGTNGQSLKDQAKYQSQEEWLDLGSLINSSDSTYTKLGQNDVYTQLDINTDKVQETRNSLSRDSGFMSPVNFNINNDEMLNISEANGKSSEFMPIITHITSLNPTAVLLDGGKCIVCGRNTRNKCLRCYINYYCSYDCQVLDWKRHNQDCTKWANRQKQ